MTGATCTTGSIGVVDDAAGDGARRAGTGTLSISARVGGWSDDRPDDVEPAERVDRCHVMSPRFDVCVSACLISLSRSLSLSLNTCVVARMSYTRKHSKCLHVDVENKGHAILILARF